MLLYTKGKNYWPDGRGKGWKLLCAVYRAQVLAIFARVVWNEVGQLVIERKEKRAEWVSMQCGID